MREAVHCPPRAQFSVITNNQVACHLVTLSPCHLVTLLSLSSRFSLIQILSLIRSAGWDPTGGVSFDLTETSSLLSLLTPDSSLSSLLNPDSSHSNSRLCGSCSLGWWIRFFGLLLRSVYLSLKLFHLKSIFPQDILVHLNYDKG